MERRKNQARTRLVMGQTVALDASESINVEFTSTYATFTELFGINWRCEVQSPSIIRQRILPIYEAFRSLTNSSTCRHIVVAEKNENVFFCKSVKG